MNIPGLNKIHLTSQQKALLLGIAGVVVIFIILVFLSSGGNTKQPDVKLTVWGTEGKDALETLTAQYHQIRPNVEVAYRQIDAGSYEQTLLNALAAGQGPDVFMINNRWLPKEKSKLVPATSTQISAVQIQDLFPAAVEQDFVADGQVYALPLYVDTLAMVYNKDLFDQAGLTAPPGTWDEFQKDIPLLTRRNDAGQLLRAGAAIGGTGQTVDQAVDLLSVLMMQNGARMTDNSFTTASFASGESGNTPGLDAFNFYLQFANPSSRVYTWNENLGPAGEAFAAGKVAITFAYQSQIAGIKQTSPFLRLGIAPLPQTDPANAVSFPSYWGFAVSKQSSSPTWGWDFAIYTTIYPTTAKIFLDATGYPPALRTMIAQTAADPQLGVFAKQALTARSWYQADDERVTAIFNRAISDVLQGKQDPDRALREAQDQITQIMQQQLH